MSPRPSALLSVALLLGSACTAPYLNAQTGRVTPRHEIRAELGAGFGVATSAGDLIRAGLDATKSLQTVDCPTSGGTLQQCFRADDFRPVVKAAFQLALASPVQPQGELAIRYGLFDRVEIGGRLGTGTYRLEAAYQLFGPTDSTPGLAGSVHVGWNHHTGNFVTDVLEQLQGDAGRDDLDLAFIAGRQYGEYVHLFFGGRYMLSRWTLELVPSFPLLYDSGEVQDRLLGTDESGLVHQLGAVVGGAAGYKHFHAGAELNLVYYRGQARLLSTEQQLSGLAVVPGVFLFTTW